MKEKLKAYINNIIENPKTHKKEIGYAIAFIGGTVAAFCLLGIKDCLMMAGIAAVLTGIHLIDDSNNGKPS